MNKYYKKKYAGFFSFLFVINPISLSQLMMYYSDGFVYNLFMYGLTIERFIHLNKDYFIDCNVQAELNYSDFLISYLQHKKEYSIYNMENVVNEK